MKKYADILLTLLLMSFSALVYGQDCENVEDMYLKGKWKGTCATAIIDHASIENCKLCTFVVDPKNKKNVTITEVDMTFGTDSLTLTQNGKEITVSYTRNKDNHSFDFVLNGKPYHFRLFLYNKLRIIEDNEGMLVVLEKSK